MLLFFCPAFTFSLRLAFSVDLHSNKLAMDDNDTTTSKSLHFQNPNSSHQHQNHQQQQQLLHDDHHDDNNKPDDGDGGEEEHDEVEQFGATEIMAFESENLDFVPSSSVMVSETTDQPTELAVSSSSQQQKQLPTGATELDSLCIDGIKEQVGALKSDISAGVTVSDSVPQTENQLACFQCPTSSELSPSSVTQSSSLTIVEEKSILNSRHCQPVPKSDTQRSSDLQATTVVPITKTPCPDGYNWRKYGQKQVKSIKGSRSYFKCTYSDCLSKKIECSDHSGGVIETIYKGTHIHDPLRKSSIAKESRHVALSVESGFTAHPIKTLGNLPSSSSMEHIEKISPHPESKRLKLMDSDGTNVTAHPIKTLGNLPSSSSMEHIEKISPHPESKQLKLMDSDGTNELIKDEQVDEPKPKKRLKKNVPACPDTDLKPDKKPELVVHAAGDVGISSDGYRWRKYGQKMVKGTPHPRNYYRCTSAGCPARKHIETAIDNTSALMIAYKGVHNHNVPVPKKRQGPPSADIVAAVAPLSMNTLQLKSCDAKINQISSTQQIHETEDQLMSESQNIVGVNSMEPARTLLSVGFEIKPC